MLIFARLESTRRYLWRMNENGSESRRISSAPIGDVSAISPDGMWVVAWTVGGAEDKLPAQIAYAVDGAGQQRLCDGRCFVSWSPDNSWMLLAYYEEHSKPATMLVLPIARGRALPEIPKLGIRSRADWANLTGVKSIELGEITRGTIGDFGSLAAGPGAAYAFQRISSYRNLYRIPIPR